MGEFCRRTVSTIWHYHGGCLVGKVVDRNFRVIGIDALRVVDGSIFTVSPGLMTVRGVDNLLVCWYEDTQRENEIELTTYPVTLLCQKELVAYFAANLLAIYQSAWNFSPTHILSNGSSSSLMRDRRSLYGQFSLTIKAFPDRRPPFFNISKLQFPADLFLAKLIIGSRTARKLIR
ncbi:hypothetical protein G4B88_029450 [Cannabis sativa]|uniref:Glucose-methanol-choline oxidoreductase C-terminal domain-containing protein n=1 Tax=Cannabis sativa TaxID=3483 RepID=A0A7J6HCT7_CANSA|nr:hypothetical protein G4B88_029450 [Cannabis sativa]